jgi:putative aldouronate transport system permease protein
MDPTVLNNQGLSFHIKDWTLDAYRRVLENGMIWRGFLNSFLYSLAFAAISVFVTLLAAYPMSKKEFVGRKFFNVIFLITMFFGGGMIPTFILINQLHMVNTVWAILIPGAFNVWQERTISPFQKNCGRHPQLTGQMRSSISSRL